MNGRRNGDAKPTAHIAELFGVSPHVYREEVAGTGAARKCPFRDTTCDVSANRNSVAVIDLTYRGIASEEREAILRVYGEEELALGICSCWTTRQNETVEKPWILCPKRLLSLERPRPLIPAEVHRLIDIAPGTRVGVWSELKFRRREPQTNRFFEYTFDYLLNAIDDNGEPIGSPYIIEVMTSSTRGGGLQEHMVDVLLGRDQRHLGKIVKSVYTPNYRQVFERMLGQLVAKSEIAEAWGGKTIWVLQDVLLDYIEQTTAFDSSKLEGATDGNVFMEVYRLERPSGANHAAGLHLAHHKSLRGRARATLGASDYTSMLGLGYAPPLDDLKRTLREGYRRYKGGKAGSWFQFIWGEDIDPRLTEPKLL